MQSGPGYWLVPKTGNVYQVETTHDRWLLVSANQKTVGLTPTEIGVLSGLDPQRDLDEIRMVGLRAGVIRIRDRRRNLTFQFDASPNRLQASRSAGHRRSVSEVVQRSRTLPAAAQLAR